MAAKTVVSASKNIQNRLKVFQLSGKASAAPGRRWNGMARVSIDAFNCKGVMFVVDIEDMPSLYIMTTVSRKPRQIPGIS